MATDLPLLRRGSAPKSGCGLFGCIFSGPFKQGIRKLALARGCDPSTGQAARETTDILVLRDTIVPRHGD
jgi:hypothetical protein